MGGLPFALGRVDREKPVLNKEVADMNLWEYARYDGLGLADLIRKKEMTASQVAALMLEGVKKINPKINAIIEVYYDRIEKADQLLTPGKPFSGVPFFLKDIGATEAGRLQEMGSRLAKGYTADTDAYLTIRFKEAGLILAGRTATPELGLAATTESVLTGATHNPWDLDRIAGGSSGGAAAAVAAGIVPAAHASDGGGSIRIPAACCGVVGLKPSRGRVTSGPIADERLFGLVQEFIVCRSVRDAAAMLDVVSRPAPGDPFVIVQPRQPYLREVGAPTGKLRIAFTEQSWTMMTVDPEIVNYVRDVARRLAAMGHNVEQAVPKIDLEPYFNALQVMWGSSLRFLCDQLADKMNRRVDARHLEPVTKSVYESSRYYSAAEVIRARSALNATRRRVGAFFENYDVLLTPTTAQLPVPLGTIHQDQDIPLEDWYHGTAQFNAFTSLSNATGLPAISLPLFRSATGLPIGMQFMAGFAEESLLIRLAAALEQAMPWADRKPPIHIGNP
jgi:amidase